jgi:hypothetical protein
MYPAILDTFAEHTITLPRPHRVITQAQPAAAAPAMPPAGAVATPMLRVNPMAGARLGTGELAAGLQAYTAAQQRKTALRDGACDELYALGAELTGAERNRVLALKRAVYNNRPPAPGVDAAQWPPAVTGYLAAEAGATTAAEELTGHYAANLAAERRALAELVATEDFQLALVLNSPNVYEACRRYSRSAGAPDSRDRKSERGIIQHVSRAMVRTSPLSRFTAVGFGQWTEGAPGLDDFGTRTPDAQSFTHVDRGLFAHLVTGIVHPPAPDGAVPAVVGRNRTLKPIDGAMRFQQSRAGEINLVSAPLTPALQLLLDLTATGPLGADALAAAVAERQGVTVAQAAGLIAAAVRAQILVAGPAVDEQAENPIPDAQALLAVEHGQLAELVAGIGKDVAIMRTGTVGQRIGALDRIAILEQQLNAVTTTPAKVHVNEDYVLPPFAVSGRGYQDALDDLAHVTEFYSLFDRHHVRRALLRTAFRDRYGAGASVPLIFEADALIAAVDAMEGRVHESEDGALRELLRQRAVARAAVVEAVTGSGDDIVLDPRWLAGLAADLPGGFRATPASHCLIVQPADRLLVVNDCHAGRGLLGMRFLGHDRALGGTAAVRAGNHVRQQFGGSHRLLEDRGLHSANINHRIQVLEDSITAEQWIGVRLAHDRATDTLHLFDRDGAPVHPVTLGMKWTDMMPAPLRIAMWLVDSGLVAVDVHERSAQLEATAAPQTVTHPRVRAGRVVMQRRRWFPGEDLPTPGGSDAEFLLRMTEWRAAHGVPDQVVIKTPEARIFGRATEPLGDYLAQRRKEKPQYLDLASALYVRTLPKLIERRSAGYFEEALPAPRDGAHAHEWAIEYDRPAHGRFSVSEEIR